MALMRNTFRTANRPATRSGAAIALAALALTGCSTDSVTREGADSLRASVLAQSREQLAEAGAQREPAEITRIESELPFDDERIEELDQMAGPGAYDLSQAPAIGSNLRGEPSDILPISLGEAIRSAVESNLDIQTARLNPALGRQQLLAAQAAFDWTLFADATYSRVHEPQAVPVLNGVALGSSVTKSDAYNFDVGLRKQLTTGGAIEIYNHAGRIDVVVDVVGYFVPE